MFEKYNLSDPCQTPTFAAGSIYALRVGSFCEGGIPAELRH